MVTCLYAPTLLDYEVLGALRGLALAEMLNATLVTCDEKFGRSAGFGCRIETIT